MRKLKYFVICLFSISLLIFASCKKVTNYAISDSMKEYFDYHKGSYWIYKNDSTGLLDSTYVRSYNHTYGNRYNDDKQITEEAIEFDYRSGFLSRSYMAYIACGGPNYYTIASEIFTSPSDTERSGDVVAYNLNWPVGTKIIPGCSKDAIFYYQTKPSDTINNVRYYNVIYTDIITIDSSLTNPNLYIRKIYFAKNIGIIKYYEFYPYFKINRSFTMVRYKAIQ